MRIPHCHLDSRMSHVLGDCPQRHSFHHTTVTGGVSVVVLVVVANASLFEGWLEEYATLVIGLPSVSVFTHRSGSDYRWSKELTDRRDYASSTSMSLLRSRSTYSGASSPSETTVSAASSCATGIIALRPNLVWSATMMSLLAISIIFCSDPTTSVLLLLNPASETLPMPIITTSARIRPNICSQSGPSMTRMREIGRASCRERV